MKRASLVLALLLLAAPSHRLCAAGASLTSTDVAFLQSLAPSQPSGGPAIGIPAPQNATCSVTRDCGDGNVASCTGGYSCMTTNLGVSCEGRPSNCPHACTASAYCDRCNTTVTCFSTTGPCMQTETGVSCDSHQFPACSRFC